jgi:hypothetical protein
MSKIEVNAIEPQCGTNLTVGASGDTITFPTGTTIVNNGSQTGFGRTGTVDWQTGSIKTANFTATSGEGYFCNTTSGSFTLSLPAGSAGAIVSVQDYNNTFNTNSLVVDPNGTEKINGGAAGASVSLSTEGEGVTLVYIDSTVGWRSVQDNNYNTVGSNFVIATGGTVTTCGDCKIHTFTGPGTFSVTSSGSPTNSVVSYTVVAGGGGGGSGSGGAGGGGGGGFREYKSPVTPYTASPLDGNPGGTEISVTAQGYPITVGGGGLGTPACTPDSGCATSGSNSIFSTVTSAGGGAAGSSPTNCGAGVAGGSGGGGRYSGNGGAGNTPPVSPAQGFGGGNSVNSGRRGGGGGGGATEAGVNGTTSSQGRGGAGAPTQISGSALAYAGGGGGAGWPGGSPAMPPGLANNGSPCGTGGSGAGSPTAATDGTTNRGGGGGGSGNPGAPGSGTAGNGGSGIVIIRYKYQ